MGYDGIRWDGMRRDDEVVASYLAIAHCTSKARSPHLQNTRPVAATVREKRVHWMAGGRAWTVFVRCGPAACSLHQQRRELIGGDGA
jgi:hypothetical protein